MPLCMFWGLIWRVPGYMMVCKDYVIQGSTSEKLSKVWACIKTFATFWTVCSGIFLDWVVNGRAWFSHMPTTPQGASRHEELPMCPANNVEFPENLGRWDDHRLILISNPSRPTIGILHIWFSNLERGDSF